MKNLLSILLLLLVLTTHAVGQDMENLPVLNWEKVAELPPDEGS